MFLIGSIGSKFIQFFLLPLYTYTLSTSQYGITEIVLTSINFLIPIFSLSIADGFLRFGLDCNTNKDDVTNNVLRIVFVGSVVSILFIPVFRLSTILSKWIPYFLLILNLRIYRDVLSIRLKIFDNNKLYAVDSMLYTFVLCVLSFIFLVPLHMEIQGYFLAYVFANFFSIFFIIFTSKFSIKTVTRKIDKVLMKQMIIYSLPMIVNGVAWWITNASDRFMLEWFMTEADVGIYSVATKLPSFITTFTGVFSQAWVISSVVEYDREREKKFYEETFHKYYFLLFLGSALLILILRPFMTVYVGQSFSEAWLYAPLLITSAVASGISAFTVGIYAASMKNLNVTITTLVGGLVNIFLNLVFIPRLGILGAAVATYVSWTLIVILRLFDIKHFFGFYIDYAKLLIFGLLNICQAIVLIFATPLVSTIISCIVVVTIILIERNMVITMLNIILKKIRGCVK